MGHLAALAAPGSHSPGCSGNLYDQYLARMQTRIPAPETIVCLYVTRQELLQHLTEAGQCLDDPPPPLDEEYDHINDLVANIEAIDNAIVDWLVTYIPGTLLLEAKQILDDEDRSPEESHEDEETGS